MSTGGANSEHKRKKLLRNARIASSSPRSEPNDVCTRVMRLSLAQLLDGMIKAEGKQPLDHKRLAMIIMRRHGVASGKTETLPRIAEDIGLTKQRVKQLESKGIEALFSYNESEGLSRDVKAFSTRARRWLSKRGGVAEGQEILKHFRRYLDFGGYSPSVSMALLCRIVGLFVVLPFHEGDVWFVSLSEAGYKRFAEIYELLAHSSVDKVPPLATKSDYILDALTASRFLDRAMVELIQRTARRVIGPKKIMRFNDFVADLFRRCPSVRVLSRIVQIDGGEKPITGKANSRLICNLAGICQIPATEHEQTIFGQWVSCNLTKRTQAIARAIIYSGVSQGISPPAIEPIEMLKKGTPADQIISDVAHHTGIALTERALDELCRRNSNVFFRTRRYFWGLAGAGATRYDAGKPIGQLLTIVDILTDALRNSPEGRTLPELVNEVRRKVPGTAEKTLLLYLTKLYKERFENITGNVFRLSQKYLEFCECSHGQMPTIDLVTRTLKESEMPLTVDEIIRACEEIQFVSHAVVRVYLSQNYGSRFRQLDDGRYVASSTTPKS